MVRKAARTKRSLKHYVVTTLLMLGVAWLLYLNYNILRKEEVARRAAQDTQKQLASLHVRRDALQRNINELSTDRGQEATLRQTFGVAKPGESVIIIVPPKVATTTPPVSFWRKWFGWILFWQKR
jgi:cell division protein FtsB